MLELIIKFMHIIRTCHLFVVCRRVPLFSSHYINVSKEIRNIELRFKNSNNHVMSLN